MIQGSHWRVGIGSSINIWQDKWLPNSLNQKVLSPRTILLSEARVSNLIDGSDFQPRWKGTLINYIFFPFEADIIKSIPLSVRRPANSLIWTKNHRGVFSVRSAYFLQKEIEEAANGNMASNSDAGRRHSFWKQVWFVMIPPKIKNFIWRACTDSLPLQTKLFDRKILNTFSCVLCLEAAESCTHLLWECSFAQAIWQQAPFGNSFRLPLHISFTEVIDVATQTLHTPKLEIFFVALWMIWNCRNKLIFENKEPRHADIWNRAAIYTLEFMEINKRHTVTSGNLITKW